jgi:UDP-N-acetylglucosamine 2-epimerase (non-hydrolysing)
LKICVALGTRPEIIKMSPVIRALEKKKAEYFILHTGQHYSYNLDQVFFDQLALPHPRYNLDTRSGTQAEETGRMMVGAEKVFLKERPDVLLVEGDTNTVLATSLAACKMSIRIGHVEAGLRSRDMEMPEEVNRILTDHVSSILFAPTKTARQNLLDEGFPEKRILVTGNTVVDAVRQNLAMAKKGDALERFKLIPKGYVLATLHRQESVDRRERLVQILEGFQDVSETLGLPVVIFTHPRTRKRIRKFRLKLGAGIRLFEPADYLSFLQLEGSARLILTDSGGVQEEACILRVPCVTVRENTERPETVEVGANIVSGRKPAAILAATTKIVKRRTNWLNPYGDGNAGARIVEAVLSG